MGTAIVMQFYAVYNDKNPDLLDVLLASDYVGQVNGREIAGAAAAKRFVAGFLAAFPDVHYTIHDLIASGDKYTVRWSATATHSGAFLGIEPTHRPVSMLGITIFQITDQRIAALWNVWDAAGLLEQIRPS